MFRVVRLARRVRFMVAAVMELLRCDAETMVMFQDEMSEVNEDAIRLPAAGGQR